MVEKEELSDDEEGDAALRDDLEAGNPDGGGAGVTTEKDRWEFRRALVGQRRRREDLSSLNSYNRT